MSETLQVPSRRGITQRDVWLAVDAVVGQGRRPTIDAVRQQLGRGSPNTIQAHLDSWFAHLGKRLGEGGEPVASPLPPFLTAAASHLWEAALSAAREVAADELQQQQRILLEGKTDLEAQREALRHLETALTARMEGALASARQATEERIAADRREAVANERLARIETQVSKLSDELSSAAVDLRDARHQLQEERTAAAHARTQADARLSGQQHHWLAELERARAETAKAVKARADLEATHQKTIEESRQRSAAAADEMMVLRERLNAALLGAARSEAAAATLAKTLGRAKPRFAERLAAAKAGRSRSR
jgi:hypothetical protein